MSYRAVPAYRSVAGQGFGLGAWQSTIPPECWDQSGFKACNLTQYNVAKTKCQGIGQDNDGCIAPIADQLTMANCKCTKKTANSSSSSSTTTPKPKPVIVSPSTPGDPNAFEPQPMIFGMDMKTVAMVGLVVVGGYIFLNKKKGS